MPHLLYGGVANRLPLCSARYISTNDRITRSAAKGNRDFEAGEKTAPPGLDRGTGVEYNEDRKSAATSG